MSDVDQRPRRRYRRSRNAYPVGRFAGLSRDHREDDAQEIYILGLSSTLFREDSLAQFFDEGQHLMPWHGDQTLQVDRYDVRLLLEDLTVFDQPANQQAPPEDEDEQLDEERYLDLDYSKEWELEHLVDPHGAQGSTSSSSHSSSSSSSSSSSGSSSASSSSSDGDDSGAEGQHVQRHGHGGYAAVGFAYHTEPQNGSERPEVKEIKEELEEPYQPCFQDVPEALKGSLPLSEKHHKILVETAKFVRKGGGQVEVLLRVKQASNATFSFLMPGDRVYPYYRWIVDTNPKELERPKPEVKAEPELAAEAGPVQGPELPSGLDSLLQHYDDEGEEGRAAGLATSTAAAEGPDTVAAAGTAGAGTVDEGDGEQPHKPRSSTPGPAADGAGDDVSAIINKLVGFVKRSGAKFEATVRQREAVNPRFAFLLPWNQNHAVYKAALAVALGSDQAASDLLAESAVIVAKIKAVQGTQSQAAAQRATSPAPGTATAAPTATNAGGSASTGSAEGDEGSDVATMSTGADADVTAPQESTPIAPVAFGPAPRPLLLKANPKLAKAVVLQQAGKDAALAAAMVAAGLPIGQQGQPHAQDATTGAQSDDTSIDSQGVNEAAEAATAAAAAAEEERERKLQERRARAKQLLLQKLAAKQQEEQRQRAQAVMSHRNAFMSDDAMAVPASMDGDKPEISLQDLSVHLPAILQARSSTPPIPQPAAVASTASVALAAAGAERVAALHRDALSADAQVDDLGRGVHERERAQAANRVLTTLLADLDKRQGSSSGAPAPGGPSAVAAQVPPKAPVAQVAGQGTGVASSSAAAPAAPTAPKGVPCPGNEVEEGEVAGSGSGSGSESGSQKSEDDWKGSGKRRRHGSNSRRHDDLDSKTKHSDKKQGRERKGREYEQQKSHRKHKHRSRSRSRMASHKRAHRERSSRRSRSRERRADQGQHRSSKYHKRVRSESPPQTDHTDRSRQARKMVIKEPSPALALVASAGASNRGAPAGASTENTAPTALRQRLRELLGTQGLPS